MNTKRSARIHIALDILANQFVREYVSKYQNGCEMISTLLIAMALFQSATGLIPGTGIVTGSIHFEGGNAAAGVRVGAMPVSDPSSMVSVTETDAAGRYRLTNIPAGKYFIVAGRLDHLTYFPGGTDQTKATTVTVDAAKIASIAEFSVPAGSKRTVAPSFSLPQSDPGIAAFREITAQKDRETKKKMLLGFEKNYPKSSRIAEVYIELSHLLAGQSDFRAAYDYAEKAVAAVNRLKAETPPDFDHSWRTWVASLEVNARDNLAWAKQMVAWQQKTLQSTILRH
jgi:hypothetical protein